MREPMTVQKLMQAVWIPILTALFSAVSILSLQHGMFYIGAMLLAMLYSAIMAAKRGNLCFIEMGKKLKQGLQRCRNAWLNAKNAFDNWMAVFKGLR